MTEEVREVTGGDGEVVSGVRVLKWLVLNKIERESDIEG